MRVFVAGARGAIGRQLVPRLVAAGHEVHGMTRSESKLALLEELGAVPVVADALDPDKVAQAVARANPEVIVHELTAIGAVGMRHFDRDFALTNRLRIEATDNLLSAGRAVGVRRFVAHSVGAYAAYARTGGPIKTEEDPLDPTPPREMRETAAAIRQLEDAVLGAAWTEGIVLRYGVFYGPGTSLAPGGAQFELVRKRKFPLVGGGGGVWSFIHVADAAEATVAAVERGRRGVYNVVDDDPAAVAEWLPVLAQRLGARKPIRVPRFVGRLFAGEAGVVMMTQVRGASNAKAKRDLGWRPAHPSWRHGFTSLAASAKGGMVSATQRELASTLSERGTVVLTTFKRDRTGVPTPVSVAVEHHRIFFRTYTKAWKHKRLARNPYVEVAPSTFRGTPRGPTLPAQARLLAGDDVNVARHALGRRHPLLQRLLVPWLHRLLRYETVHYELTARTEARPTSGPRTERSATSASSAPASRTNTTTASAAQTIGLKARLVAA